MKTSEIFQKVLERVKDPRQVNFICLRIQNLPDISNEKKKELTELIRKRLDGSFTYGAWVKKNYPEIFIKSQKNKTYEKDAYEGRIAWLNELIREFKEKGD